MPFGECEWLLDPRRAMVNESLRWLIISDLHLGKARHFQRSGIPVPASMTQTDLDRLASLIKDHQPDRVVLLGDLFHSDENRDWAIFAEFVKDHFPLHFTLVQGNHDILDRERYEEGGLELVNEIIDPHFIMRHEPGGDGELPLIAGHLHPGIRLRGRARQSMRLPCFYIQEKTFILPAFGRFTGTALIHPQKNDRIIAIAENGLVEL
ncbi:MAG: ligase-associated DNA damage response endonuclease PdeM [Bacteroidota bacterium]|nr:ligase-associated DNA damage response endonuclease PdeM [Bacteroidota bacterium]MDX5427531.1 ligase-associated DNA damage response endonuclease PdeM [Bacteroidota bacterium]MDX5447611.1 ligase-associated DNA damage response endonuclease PdeM [Bacteroidota bacterium]MDX5505456.1 ligase-associated DNA damage response endonuclease PdeM [Bacteroidota bacterium]